MVPFSMYAPQKTPEKAAFVGGKVYVCPLNRTFIKR